MPRRDFPVGLVAGAAVGFGVAGLCVGVYALRWLLLHKDADGAKNRQLLDAYLDATAGPPATVEMLDDDDDAPDDDGDALDLPVGDRLG